MKPKEIAKKIIARIAEATERFSQDVTTTQNALYSRVLSIVKELALNKNGTIKTTTANLRLLNSLNNQIKQAVMTDAYQKRVNGLVRTFPLLKADNDDYFQAIVGAFKPDKALYNYLQEDAVQVTLNTLTGAGMDVGLVEPVKEIIKQNITTGGNFGELVDVLRERIKGTPTTTGIFEKYANQITTDALNQYNANYTKMVTDDLDLVWYLYSGGVKSNSRRYCRDHAGDYMHKKEIEESSRERWSGKHSGTTESTIFVYRGGYKCGHQWLPVLESGVPESYLKRAKEKGYIK